MIEEGQNKKVPYWGKFTVRKVARLKVPVECQSSEIGKALFNPTLVKIEWDKPPSDDKNEFWFPYWINIKGKEKYGQFAPMIGERALLELLQNAMDQGFFSEDFLQRLGNAINAKISSK